MLTQQHHTTFDLAEVRERHARIRRDVDHARAFQSARGRHRYRFRRRRR
jgi:hypothetical protein